MYTAFLVGTYALSLLSHTVLSLLVRLHKVSEVHVAGLGQSWMHQEEL